MSHDATNWASKQRGLSMAARIVLWHLCDRYHPDHGCFPKQQTLTYDCEMSRATLNRALLELEEQRLIRRETRVDPETKRQLPTRYYFNFHNDFDFNRNADEHQRTQVNEGEQQSVSQDDTRVSRVSNLSKAVSQISPEPCLTAETLREPVSLTSKGTSKRAREDDLFAEPVAEKRQGVSEDESFAELWSLYPNKTAKVAAVKAYRSALKRGIKADTVKEGLERYITTKPVDRPWLHLSTFINQERWNDAPAPVFKSVLERERAKLMEELENDGYGRTGNSGAGYLDAGGVPLLPHR